MVTLSTYERRKRVTTAIIFFIGALYICWGFAPYVSDVVHSHHATTWPKTEGTVISSKTVRGRSKRSPFYPAVSYRYFVNGEVFVGQRISYCNCDSGSESSAAAIADRFPVSSVVNVYVNPQQPTDSVLIAGKVPVKTWLVLGFMSFIFVLCLFMAFRFIREDRPSETRHKARWQTALLSMLVRKHMPACPECSEIVTLSRWLSSCGRGMDLHTRCNKCGSKIRAYVPWYAGFPLIFAPIAIIAWSKFVGEVPGILLVLLLVALLASIPLGYALFGKVIRDE